LKAEEFLEGLRRSCRVYGLPTPFVDEKRPGTIKIRIKLSSRLHASFYYNEETGTLTSALILRGKRILGYDAYPAYNSFHLHPLHNVENHQKSKELSIEEMIQLYSETVSKVS